MNIIFERAGAMQKLIEEQNRARLNQLLALLPHYAVDDEQRAELLEKIRIERHYVRGNPA